MIDKLTKKREDKFGLDRIVFFTDAVIAIAITLLVIELKVPHLAEGESVTKLSHYLNEMWPEFLGYAVSFMVIAMYWMAHHKIFRNIADYDRPLIYINTVFLMFIAFMPFVTGLLFNYPAQLISVIWYAVLVALIGLALLWVWSYAKNHRLVYDEVEKKESRRITFSLLITPVVFAFSIVIALFSPKIAMFSWIILLPLYVIANRIKKKRV